MTFRIGKPAHCLIKVAGVNEGVCRLETRTKVEGVISDDTFPETVQHHLLVELVIIATILKKRVEFRAYDGTILRGDYLPVEMDNSPIVVMTQSVTLLKECYVDDIARVFQQAGIAALVYDHRGRGSSEGTPFQEVNPLQQAEDNHDAVTFVRTLAPAADPSRVAIWGIGHSGGASMIAAADDPRIKVACLIMPWTSGRKDIESFPDNVLQRALAEREEHVNQANSRRACIPVWDDNLGQVKSNTRTKSDRGCVGIDIDTDVHGPWLHGEGFYSFISGDIARSRAGDTPWENRMTLQSLYHISRVEPRDWIYKIVETQLFLYVAAATDVLTGSREYHKSVFSLSRNPKAKFVQTGESRMDNHFGNFEAYVKVQLDFLRDAL